MDANPTVATGSSQASAYPLYPAAVILPTLAAVVILLDVPPLVWHARNRNLAAFSLVSWIILLNLFNFVNPLIWPRDDIPNWWNGEGLCDIQARLIVGASVGVPGCMLCIMLSLARVLDTDRGDLTPTKSQRFRRRLMELLLCFGFPIVIMIVYYVVQSRRYWIHGIAGCNWDYHPSWASIVVVLVWPTVLEVFDAIIAALVITRLFKYHKDFASILEASNTTASRFVRLFCMTLILIVGTLPVQVYVLAYNMSGPLQPYSWSEVHGDSWDTIMTVPSYGTVLFYRWTWIVMGFLVFVFFGMGRDASSMYRRWLEKLGFRIRPAKPSTARSASASSRGSRAKLMWSRKSSHVESTVSGATSHVDKNSIRMVSHANQKRMIPKFSNPFTNRGPLLPTASLTGTEEIKANRWGAGPSKGSSTPDSYSVPLTVVASKISK